MNLVSSLRHTDPSTWRYHDNAACYWLGNGSRYETNKYFENLPEIHHAIAIPAVYSQTGLDLKNKPIIL